MDKIDKILFIGSSCPRAIYAKLQQQHAISDYAAYTFQDAIISGLLANGCDLDVLTAPSILSYPKSNILFYKGFSIRESNGINWRGISFINLPVIRLVSKFIKESIALYNTRKSGQCIIIYSLPSFQLLASVLFARKNRKYVIITDLPEYMSGSKNCFYRLLKKIDRSIIEWALKRITGFVLLSQQMQDRLSLNNKPSIVIEGIYKDSKCSKPSKDENYKILLYTGSIEERYGVKDLLEAFTLIKGDHYRLWLCGNGDLSMVNEYMSKDYRIVYHGSLPHTTVLEMQQKASLLVNPRHSYEEFTRYSFPSKTMEYMASGTPTLMCQLQSLPKEYYPYLFFFKNETVDGMSRRIKELLDTSSDDMNTFGAAASKFIIENKNAKVQTYKIIDMIYKSL